MPNETVDSITGVAAVYVQTNQTESNKLVAFERAADGTLKRSGEYETAFAGDGVAHLASQGSVALAGDGGHLLVTTPEAATSASSPSARAVRPWCPRARPAPLRRASPSTEGLCTC